MINLSSFHASRPRTTILTALAGAGVLAVLAGCGNDVPDDAVAKVGDTTIEQAEFNHWLAAAARGQQAPGAPATAVPDPPSFAKCTAAVQAQPLPKGAPPTTPARAKDQCKQQYEALRSQVMQFLISADWIEQEAEERDIEAKDEQIKKQFEDQKKQSFPDDKQYQQFLKTSGQTEQDLLFRVKLDYLSNEIRKQLVAGKGSVTPQEVQAYYAKNKEQFGQPERRDISLVLTKSRSQAEAAKSALEDGDDFRQVARRYSIDQQSKGSGGKLPGIAKGTQEKALDEAIFKAERGELTGPVQTQFGWYVFEVTKVTPGSQQSIQESRATIQDILKGQKEQKALEAFVDEFRKKYKEDTNCAAGFVVSECRNGPPEPPGGQGGQGGQTPPPQQGGQPPPQAPPQQGGQQPPPQAPPQGGE